MMEGDSDNSDFVVIPLAKKRNNKPREMGHSQVKEGNAKYRYYYVTIALNLVYFICYLTKGGLFLL